MVYGGGMLGLIPLIRRVRHGMTLGVRVMAEDDAGRLLLVRHSYLPGWHFPGGGVDFGETAAEAARRELKEEANVDTEAPLAMAGVFFNPRVGGRDHVVLFCAGRLVIGPRPARNLEIVAAEFFAPDALPEDVTPATLRRLAERQGRAPVSDMW